MVLYYRIIKKTIKDVFSFYLFLYFFFQKPQYMIICVCLNVSFLLVTSYMIFFPTKYFKYSYEF